MVNKRRYPHLVEPHIFDKKRRESPAFNHFLNLMDGFLGKVVEYLFIFWIGGTVYTTCELVARGYSHYSMFILGGICLIIVGLLNEGLFPSWMGIIPQALMGAIIITVLELATGIIVNIWLGLDIWDYSNMPLNFMGQICLPFSILWIFMAALAIVVDDYIRYLFFGEEKPHYKLWIDKNED